MIRGLLFDLNGTVIDILTDENDYHVYRVTSNFLSYYGIMISPDRLKELFFELNRQQRKTSGEEFPEFDVEKIFRDIFKSCGVSDCGDRFPFCLPASVDSIPGCLRSVDSITGKLLHGSSF